MFDVVIGSNALTLNSISVLIDTDDFSLADYEYYTVLGGITGNLDSAANWTLRDTFTDIAGGIQTFTAFDVTDFTLDANTTYGFYFTSGLTDPNGGVQYTDGVAVGNVRVSNADLSILTGVGKAYPFAGSFTPRDFNGALTYSVNNVVPEPATWAMLIAGFGLVGGAMRRRRESAALAR